ncbi:MAG TPA: SPFH domain-containing protein [Thermoanaerobaculia bacterium]|nr:SPFH domain-containing protein [Thermoanaerobaculia bacterium]
MNEPLRDDAPPEESGSSDTRGFFERLRDRLPKPNGNFRIPWGALRRLLLVVVLLAGAVALWKGAQKSFQAVAPGHVGVCANRFTGSLESLEPGTHFRPPVLYEIHPVRISDQLLSDENGVFSVTTKEGVIAKITVQARWAIDRKQLLSKWAALPPQPARELVAPVLFAAFRAVAPRYEVTRLISEKREELASLAAVSARERLAESGVVLKEVLIGDLVLPPEFEKGRIAMVDEVQSTERLEVTLKRKAREVEETRLTAEAQKARQVEEAEASAARQVIQARGEADAMKHVLELKTKQIQQKKLEAEAERQSIVERAHAAAEASKIQTLADVDRRKALADAEAYATRVTALADFEKLEREARLVTANPLLIPKTFADRISDRVQVILTPSIGGEQFTGEVFKRVADGQPPLAPPPATAVATARKSKSN